LAEHTKNHADGSPHGGPTKTHHAKGLILSKGTPTAAIEVADRGEIEPLRTSLNADRS